jgi:hypothetical protein
MPWNELSDFGSKAIRKIMFDNALVREHLTQRSLEAGDSVVF